MADKYFAANADRVNLTRTVPRRHTALVRHPMDPLPIVRARRALRQAGTTAQTVR